MHWPWDARHNHRGWPCSAAEYHLAEYKARSQLQTEAITQLKIDNSALRVENMRLKEEVQ